MLDDSMVKALAPTKITTHSSMLALTISRRDLCRVNNAMMLGIKVIGVVAKKKMRTRVGFIEFLGDQKFSMQIHGAAF